MSAQRNSSSHHLPHLQDLAAAHHNQATHTSRDMGPRHGVEPDFIMTGARIGNINGSRTGSNGDSSGRSSPFGFGMGTGGGMGMALPGQQQSQRHRGGTRNAGGVFQGDYPYRSFLTESS